MKNLLSFIRWKFVIPASILVASVLIFFIVFFDPILAQSIEWAGSRINGAKVNVSGLHTKLFQGRLSIGNLQVTDKEHTMKNILEAGPLAFQLSFYDLFSKRVIIPEASFGGLQFNTDRKSDGKLTFPPKKKKDEKPSAAEKLAEKYKDQFQVNLGEMKTDAKSKIEFDAKDLALTKQADALKVKADSLPDEWKQKVDGLNINERLKTVEAQVKEIENTSTKGNDALTSIPEGLKKLKQVKSDLEQIKSDLKNSKETLTSDVKNLKQGITGLQDAKKKDMDDLLSRLNLDFANPKRLIDGMMGGAILGKVKTALHYVEVARKYLPSKKDEEIPPKPRSGGMDIEFPKPAAPPRFWLKKASLSGIYQDVSASGVLTHLTSSPSRIGKPLFADMKGTKGSNQFLAEILADHTTDISNDSLSLQAKNLSVTKLIQDGQLAAAIKEGTGDLSMAMAVSGDDQISGFVRMDMQKLILDETTFLTQMNIPMSGNLSREDGIKADFAKNIARGLGKMADIQVKAEIGGTWADPSIRLSSNLDDMIKKIVKDSFGSVVDGQRKELEAKLDSILVSRKAELDQKAAGLQAKVNDLLGGLDSKVQEQINKSSKISLGGGDAKSGLPLKVPSLDKLFKK